MTAEFILSLVLIWVFIRFIRRLCRGIAGAVLAVSGRHGEVPRNRYGRPLRPDIAETPPPPAPDGVSWSKMEAYTKRAEGVPRP